MLYPLHFGFQFTHPGRGATCTFVHRGSINERFNSRTPGGVRRVEHCYILRIIDRFNSRTPGGVRRVIRIAIKLVRLVSIHAPREGCDASAFECPSNGICFNSRTPGGVRPCAGTPQGSVGCFNSRTPGGVRLPRGADPAPKAKFQFTHPGRGATALLHPLSQSHLRFNSRTPGGVRHTDADCKNPEVLFQFTHPGRGATYSVTQIAYRAHVSIHAPREGCDSYYRYASPGRCCFNSRTPGGVRQCHRESI